MQALGSPPRAGLLRLGTKALFSFIFTAALQSGLPTASCFLPGAVAPDLALGESPAFHIHLSTVSLCSPLGSWSGKSCLSWLLPWMQSCGYELELGKLSSCRVVTNFGNHLLNARSVAAEVQFPSVKGVFARSISHCCLTLFPFSCLYCFQGICALLLTLSQFL